MMFSSRKPSPSSRKRKKSRVFDIGLHIPILLTAGILLCSAPGPGTPPAVLTGDAPVQDSSLVTGEELTYNVSFASYDLGRVKISVLDRVSEPGSASYKASAKIDTYDGVPFVTVHTLYESRIDHRIFSRWFRKRTRDDPHWEEVTYNFDYAAKQVTIQYVPARGATPKKSETLPIDTLYQDGLSLFFFARAS